MNNHHLKEPILEKVQELEKKIMDENSKNTLANKKTTTGVFGVFNSMTKNLGVDFGKNSKTAKETSKKYLQFIEALKKEMKTQMLEADFERKIEKKLFESNKDFKLKEGGDLNVKIHEIMTYYCADILEILA